MPVGSSASTMHIIFIHGLPGERDKHSGIFPQRGSCLLGSKLNRNSG